jgi:Basophilic leukemia-expressed protein Bles03
MPVVAMNKRAISPPPSERKPSQVTDVYWLFAERKKGKYPPPTVRSGKWLIFIGADEVDEVWARVKEAAEEGRLGGKAKVATARPNPLSRTPDRRVICVYTYDYEDVEDVRRVRQELGRLGIIERIPYKTDEDTLAGRYRVKGHRGIAKYNE